MKGIGPNVILVKSGDPSFLKDMSVEGLLRRMHPPVPQPEHPADLSEFSDEELQAELSKLQSELSKRRAARARELSEKRRDHFERFCLLCRNYHGMFNGGLCYWGATAQDVTSCSRFDDRNDDRWTRIYKDEYERSKPKTTNKNKEYTT
jgi:hypothetical protein